MDSAELARILQTEGRQLVEGLYTELRSNLGTSHYHRLSNDDLFRRVQAVYQHLADWLGGHDDAAVMQSGEKLGQQRYREGIPLGQVILALVLEEKHLWEYLRSRGQSPAEPPLEMAVREYFQKMIYSTAHGYEAALAERSSQAKRAPQEPAAKIVTRADAAKAEAEIGVSRGGEIGEHGG